MYNNAYIICHETSPRSTSQERKKGFWMLSNKVSASHINQVNETIRINGVIWKIHIYICIITMNSGLQKCNNYILFYLKCVRELVWLTNRLHRSNCIEFFLKTYRDSYLGFKEVILWETCLIISTKLIELDKDNNVI